MSSDVQLPLSLRFPPDQRFEAYVGAQPVVAQLAAVARGEREDWLFISGPAASGKTHLLIAVCTEAAAQGRRAVYLPLPGVTGRLCEVLAAQEGAALIALDALEALAGVREDEIALFDFHNRARAAGAVLLYAGRGTPQHLPLSLPDLRSRLSQCVQASLAPLDDQGRREVLRRRAAMRGLMLDEGVLDWLLHRVGRDLITLTALLDRLDRESLAAQRRVTVPFLRELLRL